VTARVQPEGEKRPRISRTVEYLERPNTLPAPLTAALDLIRPH
jgi:hypothetical protein